MIQEDINSNQEMGSIIFFFQKLSMYGSRSVKSVFEEVK